MAFGPEHSAITVTDEIQKALENCSSQSEIAEIMRDRALAMGLYERDVLNPQHLIEVPRDSAPKRFAQSLTMPSGEKIIFEGESEIDVARQSNAYMREHFSQPAAESTTPPAENQPRAANGQFVERLQEAIEEIQNSRVVQSWAEATQNFLQSPEGSDWPGGEVNKNTLGRIISESPELLDAQDRQAAILAAFLHAKEHGLLVENEQVTEANSLADEISKCERPEDLRALFVRRRGGDMGMFS